MNKAISLITIDLDDTVWPCMPVIKTAEQALFQWLEQQVPRLTEVYDIASLHAHRKALQKRLPHLAHDITAVRLASLRQLFSEFGYDPGRAEEAFAVFIRLRNRVRPYRDVAPVLDNLQTNYCLISVTNGNADVARTPLKGRFHHSFNAAQAGAMKPDPAIFLQALEAAGVGPEQAVHVGDDPELDIAPAQTLGMRSIWVNRGGKRWPKELPPPDATVSDLFGLREWLYQQPVK